VTEANIHKKDQAFAVLLTIAFTAGPFGFGVPTVFACISWVVAWGCLVYIFWNLEHVQGLGNALKMVFAILATLVVLYVTYPGIHTSYIKEKAKATSGDLVAKDDGKHHTSDFPELQIGPTGSSKLQWNGNPNPNATMFRANMDKLQLRMVNGKVLLSTTIRDQSNNLIATIEDNHWIVSTSTASCWDHNYTDDSLEVLDGRGRVVLQVRVLPSIVQFQAEWNWDANTHIGSTINEDGWCTPSDGIKRRFKYPSELYWGQLRDTPGY
jgi:hypothetical protein